MIVRNLLFAGAAVLAVGALAVQHHEGYRPESKEKMTFTADRIAIDSVTGVAVASGHVHAVHAPYSLLSDLLERDETGQMTFHAPTCVTTCTNEVGHTHWNVTGEVIYRSNDSVVVHDAWLRFCEVPVFYLPYLWYPLDTKCGFQWMPGYTSRWGAFLLTKFSYGLLGDPYCRDNTWWLVGNTSFDMRMKNGLAAGEDLKWNLGDYGFGGFRFYHAWDRNVDDRYGSFPGFYNNWGSSVPENRYGWTLTHRWQATERDTLFVRASYKTDSYFDSDFMRKGFFEIKEQWQAYENSGAFWEHLEERFVVGAEVSGRLNDFYTMTERLPEIYFDLNPQPLFGLPVNYEMQNHAGFLRRHYAEYGAGIYSDFGIRPGLWCDYEAFRLDTYHRLTAPFRTLDDRVSVVPRVGYHGTYWSETGSLNLTGATPSRDEGDMCRSIGEAGVTLATRATGWVDDTYAHMVEPYLDILVQEAWYTGDRDGRRPYVFDNADASLAWEDQFAGRGRNLPYSYYGVTPGVRNAWSRLEENGNLSSVLDVDAYAALMFDRAEFEGVPGYGDYEAHKLAKLGDRNYGAHGTTVMPGARLKWTPDEDLYLGVRSEYDTDRKNLALADVSWRQVVTKDFNYEATYGLRNHRYWDFSSVPLYRRLRHDDELNELKYQYARLACEYQPLEWLAFGSFIRWDIRESELDTVGGWVEYLTDCLGFRFLVEYENEYELIDGYRMDEDWSFGFIVRLRALGQDSGNIFGAR